MTIGYYLLRAKHRLLGIDPRFVGRNMFSERHRLVLGFSPKAACTVGAKMFFHHIGLLDEALAFDPWIHRFRTEYARHNLVDPARHWRAGYVKIKLVRNPYSRAVSGWLHAMRQPYLDRELCRFFAITDRHELSFSRYLGWLERRLDWKTNEHNGWQLRPGELKRFPYDFILRIESLDAGLAEIRARFGVQFDISDPRILDSHHHLGKTPAEPGSFVDVPFRQLLTHADGLSTVPGYQAFYDDRTRERVRALFQRDLDAYGYGFPD